MKITNVLKVAKKEIQAYLNSPSSYIVAVVFLILWEFLFFRNAFLIGEVSLRGLYAMFPWLMLLLVPAITMGAVAKEKDDGTLEWILTQPISELELALGKFIGAFSFIFIVLLFTVPIAFTFSRFGEFDWGVYAGQFIGSILYGAAFVSLGLFVSGFVGTQIAALLVTAALGFVFIMAGTEVITMSMPSSLASISERLSLSSHMNSISRGVIDLRDIWYFLSFIFVFMGLAYLQLLKGRFGNRKAKYRNVQFGVTMLIGITILTNVIGNRISGRIDLTQDKLYTLSDSTQRIVSSLDDIVTINLYTSDKLPVQYSPILRETKDLLADYENTSKGKLVVNIKNPSNDEAIQQEAISYGIREAQFNVIGQEEFQLKTGFFGLAVSYAGKHEAIPLIQSTSDLEYQLTSFIKKLTAKEQKTVGVFTGYGTKDFYSDYSIFSGELADQYQISTVSLEPPVNEESTNVESAEPVEIDPNIDVLIIAGPSSEIGDNVKDAIRSYISQGGSVVFLIDSYFVNMQFQLIGESPLSLDDLVSEYGVTVNKDVMYDVRFNETVRFSDGVVSYYLAYPFWLRAIPVDKTNQITFKLSDVLIPWGASLSINEQEVSSKGYSVVPLLTTTPYAGVKSGELTMDPTQEFSTNNLGQKTAAVALKGNETGSIVIIGDSDLFTDQFIQSNPQNIIFGINAISWLSDEESLGDIRIKDQTTGLFMFKSEDQPTRVKYGIMGFSLIVPVLFGVVRLLNRKKLSTRRYAKSKQA